MIQLENINFGYVKQRRLFTDLNLELTGGHIYGLLGKNGAGKTTLMKIMCGMRFANSGKAVVMGEPAMWRHPSMLQDMYYLGEEIWAPDLTIDQYVNIYAPLYPKFDREMLNVYLEEFEMTGMKQKLSKMSHGQKKKAFIAFALATNVKVMLMDEPTNGLDIPSKSTFRKVMAMAADEERTFIISTHQVRDLHSLIDTIIVLDGGEILVNATTDEITEKLLFQVVDNIDEATNVIYSEDSLRGIYTVSKNTNGAPCKLDIELFFNAVMSQKQIIKNIFNEL